MSKKPAKNPSAKPIPGQSECFIYAGPTIPGVISENGLFAGELPPAFVKLAEKYPYLKLFAVRPTEHARFVQKLKNTATREHLLYERIKLEVKPL